MTEAFAIPSALSALSATEPLWERVSATRGEGVL